MPNINQEQVISTIVILLIQFVAVFTGVYVREYFSGGNRKVRIFRTLITTIAISCFLVGFSSNLIKQIGVSLYFTLSFLIGAGSNTIVESIVSGKLLHVVLKAVFYDAFTNIMESIEKKEKKDDNNNSNNDDEGGD